MLTAFIVDDDKYSVEAAYAMIPWEELRVSHIEKIYSPTGLIGRILTEKPHIVFIDIEMGNVSGLDIVRECVEQNSDACFVIITGHDKFNFAHTAVNLGVAYYLLKPLDEDDISALKIKLLKNIKARLEFSFEDDLTDLWTKIIDFIEANYFKKLQAHDIYSALYVSRTTFFNCFKANTNKTFTEYLTEFRLEKAKYLLINSRKSIPEIADLVGIKDNYYFNKIFKKNIGLSAHEYRKSHGGYL